MQKLKNYADPMQVVSVWHLLPGSLPELGGESSRKIDGYSSQA